jgi:hypothetical protein
MGPNNGVSCMEKNVIAKKLALLKNDPRTSLQVHAKLSQGDAKSDTSFWYLQHFSRFFLGRTHANKFENKHRHFLASEKYKSREMLCSMLDRD